MANAADWNPDVSGGTTPQRDINAGQGPAIDPRNLRGMYEDADPKSLFDDYTSTQSPPGGFHPYGLDMDNNDLFEPVSDNSDAGDISTGQIRPSSILPTMPIPGEMGKNK